MSNADGSLVMATYGTISSEFGALADASWLTTSYSLATCAIQPITGKLSDIYGRKGVLLASYVLFAVGSVGWYVLLPPSSFRLPRQDSGSLCIGRL